MSEQIRVGMIGTSWWSDWMHLPSLQSHPRVALAAICGRTAEPAQRMAEKYRIPAVFTDYRRMLEDCALDAIALATPDDMHYEIATAVLDKRLHLLCEKPLANDLQQAEEMARRAIAAGVCHMTLFSWRWAPVFARLKLEIDTGSIGRPLEARFAFLGNDAYSPEYRWRRDGGRCNGVLADFGAHMIDFARWCLGEIVSVSADIATHIDRQGIEPQPVNDCATLDVLTETGAHATLALNAAAHLGDQIVRMNIEIYGTEGSLEGQMVLFGSEGGSWLRRYGGQAAAPETIHQERFRADSDERPEFFSVFTESSAGPRAFIDAIVEKRPASPDLSDGAAAQRVIAAAFTAHEEGRRITL